MTRLKLLTLAVLLLLAPAAFADDYGAVRGVVHDPQHRPIQDAMVMLRAKSSEWAKSVTTDANGEFQFNAVALGDYSVSVASQGFAQTSQDVIVISGSVPVERFPALLTALNVSNHRVIYDNSLTYGGFHWNLPREMYVQVRYRFHP